MPLDLIELDIERRVLTPGDSGFLFSLAKTRWNKHAAIEAVKLLKSYAKEYYEKKCPESKTDVSEDSKVKGEIDEDLKEKEEIDDAGDKEEKNQTEASQDTDSTCPLQFVQRDLVYNNCGFVASNLADPGDFAHYIMTELSLSVRHARTKYPYRIMPVQTVSEAKPRSVEKAVIPWIEKTLGENDFPFRFSLMYRRNNDGNNLTQHEAKTIIRNCVWAVNPNCVQCIKYQDFAILVDILPPLFCMGIVKDFQRLAAYNTWTIRQGPDYTDLGEDSEDEISDDPNLDEEEEKRRKLRLRRKRRAEKAGPSEKEVKKSEVDGTEGDEDHEEEEGDELGEEGDEFGDDEGENGDHGEGDEDVGDIDEDELLGENGS